MSAFIHQYCTISCLDSFDKGILSQVDKTSSKKLIEPDCRSLIPAGHLRRMSRIVRLGIASAMKATDNTPQKEMQGIIVGTGLGCYINTVAFTKEIIESPSDGLLAPAGFIQSTDNTIAGQIGLIFGNNNYNNTYNHKGIAFENSLTDALMLVNETAGPVLIGAVDELLPQLFINENLNYPNKYFLQEGSSFFLINSSPEKSLARIEGVEIRVMDQQTTVAEAIESHIKKGTLSAPDLILYGNSFLNKEPVPQNITGISVVDYSEISGIYFTNVAFGLQFTVEILNDKKGFRGKVAKDVLVVNNYNDKLIGMIRITNE